MSWQEHVSVVFRPCIGSQKQAHSFSTQNLRTASRRFSARCCRSPCWWGPWSTYWRHEKFWPTRKNCLCVHNSLLISTPYLPSKQLVVTSGAGPILVFTRIQLFGSDDFSSLGKENSRQATESVSCEISSVSVVMKYCPTSIFVRNPASVQNLITRFCCDNLSTRSWYFCKRSSCVWSSVKSCRCFHHTCGHKQWIRLSHQNRAPCSNRAGFAFATQIWECSVNTELIHRNNCAKSSLNCSLISAVVYWQFSNTFAFWAFLGIMDSWIGRLGVRFQWMLSSALWLCTIRLWFPFKSGMPLLFWSKSEEWPSSWWKSFRINRNEFGA